MATYSVTDAGDVSAADDALTLREAIEAANANPGADIVDFSGLGATAVITLTQGEITIIEDLTIQTGDGQVIIISGDAAGNDTKRAQEPAITDAADTPLPNFSDNSRIFDIGPNATDVTLSGLTLTGGFANGPGGAINGSSTEGSLLTLTNVDIRGNGTNAEGAEGGGVYSPGTVVVNGAAQFGFSDNFTVGDNSRGGALYADTVTLTTGARFSNNVTYGAESNGGALAARSLTSTGSVSFVGNVTKGYSAAGGAVSASVADLDGTVFNFNRTEGDMAGGGAITTGLLDGYSSFTDVSVTNNDTLGQGSIGGGIASAFVDLTGSTITGNQTAGADAYGGGAFISGGTITDTLIASNQTNGENSFGGGIFGSAITLNDSTVRLNSTVGDGAVGGGIAVFGSLTTNRSLIEGNFTLGANADGGGVSAPSITTADTTFYGNFLEGSGSVGGGLSAGTASLASTTVTGNFASGSNASGGGVYLVNGGTITGSIILGNGLDGALTTAFELGGATPDFAGNNIVGLSADVFNAAVIAQVENAPDPSVVFAGTQNLTMRGLSETVLFGTLADNGGARFSVALEADAANPALDRQPTVQGLSEDIRGQGFARSIDQPAVPNAAGNATDLGAFELQPSANFAPIAVDDMAAVIENTSMLINVLANDSDPEGTDLSLDLIFGPPDDGTAVIENGQIRYTPDPDFVGMDQIRYTISDATGREQSANLTIQVLEDSPNNQPPVAVDDAAGALPNTPVLIDVLANDTDINNDTLSILSLSVPQGVDAVIENGQVRYTPPQGFLGQQSFDYTVSDPAGGTDTGTVTVTVSVLTGGNINPVATPDTAATSAGRVIVIPVLANDTDANGDTLSIQALTDPPQGSVLIFGDQVRYSPAPGFSGQESFAYIVSDGQGGTDTAAVTVFVAAEGENAPPAAAQDAASTQRNASVLIPVLANDSDADGDPLTITNVSAAASGTVAIENGAVRYTPATGFIGEDSFSYTITDGGAAGSATAVVRVTVTPPNNNAPIAANDAASTEIDVPVEISVRANDTDLDNDALVLIDVSDPANGSALIDFGDIIYTPDPGFVGLDSFTYRISDVKGGESQATVLVTVADPDAAQSAPMAADDMLAGEQFRPLFSFDPSVNDMDASGDDLSILDFTKPPGGRVFQNEDGTLAYAPQPNFAGTDSFSYTVSDGQGGESSATVQIFLAPIGEDLLCARTIAYLYEATYDRFPDIPGVNFWIDQALENGLSKEEVASFFLTAPEFLNLYGDVDTLTDRELIELLYLNTLDRPGEEEGIQFWLGVRQGDPDFSLEQLLLAFAESPENQLGSPDIVRITEVAPGEWDFV